MTDENFRRVHAVFFDAVGTLIHPDPPAPIVYQEIGQRYGSQLSTAEIRQRFITAFQKEEALDREQAWRTNEARAIEEEFQRLADDAAGRIRAIVTTAIELERADRDRVQSELSKRLNKEVRLSVVVDPRIIGGLKLQYGDRVVDASVATRLQQLRRRLAAT